MPSETDCQKYWDASDWLSPVAILEQWCQGDRDCWKAKSLALVSACERGEINYERSDGKTFEDPVLELFRRQLLLIERASFEAWVIKIEGSNPLNSPTRPPAVSKLTARPAWLDRGDSVAVAQPVSQPVPEPAIETATDAGKDDQATATAKVAPRDDSVLPSVSSQALTEAFRKRIDSYENRQWWQERLGNPGRYDGLMEARASKGQPNRGGTRVASTWHLATIAKWLINKNHMSRERVIAVIERHFPAHDSLIDSI